MYESCRGPSHFSLVTSQFTHSSHFSFLTSYFLFLASYIYFTVLTSYFLLLNSHFSYISFLISNFSLQFNQVHFFIYFQITLSKLLVFLGEFSIMPIFYNLEDTWVLAPVSLSVPVNFRWGVIEGHIFTVRYCFFLFFILHVTTEVRVAAIMQQQSG